jgi:redox-sensitive bicupin YhaK (pirin superfamily)
VSTDATDVLHGAQLWVALPDDARFVDPGFEHYATGSVAGAGWEARVFLGSLLGDTSPVTTFSPLLGAELLLEPGTALEVDVDPAFEHGVLVDAGVVSVAGQEAKPGELAYLAPGAGSVHLSAGSEPARLLLLGGAPFGESIVMWWNFVGRSHDEIVGYRREWQQQITRDGEVVDDSRAVAAGRFGVVDDALAPIPAPGLPNARLKQRR